MKAVTTFSPKGYEQYGKRCLETFVRHWPCQIEVFYEEKPDFEHEKIVYRPISELEDRKTFLSSAAKIKGADGNMGGKYRFHYDAIKFCNKVFAQLACQDDLVFWVDADTVTHADISEALLRELLEGVPYCYFGRTTYTETGFIGFNKTHPLYVVFETQYRKCYLNGILFTLPGWHDCFAFDFAKIGIEGKNLSPLGRGTEHVIAKSFLSKYIDHLKGNRKTHGHSPESSFKWW